MIDHDKLREAIKDVKDWLRKRDWDGANNHAGIAGIKLLIETAESALPRTKMVEVWRVEWAIKQWGIMGTHSYEPACEMYLTHEAADVRAQSLSGCPCLRITGPYMQEVPQ